MEDLLTTKRRAWFFLCICRYAYKAKKSCEPFEKQNTHLFENAPPKVSISFLQVAIRTMVWNVCHVPCGPLLPHQIFFSFPQRICARLCNSSVPMDCTIPIFIFWSTAADPTWQVIILPLKSSSVAEGWQEVSYSHQWVWTQNLLSSQSPRPGLYHQANHPWGQNTHFVWTNILTVV